MPKHVERMVVWASGKIEFCGAQDEPEGALTICVAHGVRAIEQLGELLLNRTEVRCFDEGMSLAVPGIDPKRPATEGIDPAVDVLVEWGDQLRNDIGTDPAFVWARA